MNEVHFTIGIPAYERPDYTRESIQSCLDQDYENFEIIVSDDSRTDEVQKVVESFNSPKIRYQRNRPSLGLPQNSNALIEQGRDWMIILANDDLLERTCLRSVNEVIQKHSHVALVRMRYFMIDEKGDVMRLDRASAYRMSGFQFLSEIFLPADNVPWMSLSGVAFPVQNLKSAGGFPDFHRGHHMDRAAWAKLAAFGNCYFIQEPQARIRSHRGEITTQMDPNYDKALQATRHMARSMDDFLLKLRPKARRKEDRKLLHLARKRLREYIRRQTSRCFDEGIMAKIEQKSFNSIFDIQNVRKEMASVKAAPFLSFYVYGFLLLLPQPLRFRIFPFVKEYKFRRWHS